MALVIFFCAVGVNAVGDGVGAILLFSETHVKTACQGFIRYFCVNHRVFRICLQKVDAPERDDPAAVSPGLVSSLALPGEPLQHSGLAAQRSSLASQNH